MNNNKIRLGLLFISSVLCSAEASALFDVKCSASAAASVFAEIDRESVRVTRNPYQFTYGGFTGTREACNQSISYTPLAEQFDTSSQAITSVVNSMVINGDTIIFESAGKTSGSAVLGNPREYSRAAEIWANARSSISVASDRSLHYRFSMSSYGTGHAGEMREDYVNTYYESSAVSPTNIAVGDARDLNEYEQEGYLSVWPNSIGHFLISGQSDAGGKIEDYGKLVPPVPYMLDEPGTQWSYRLEVTQVTLVPEPASQLMFLSGLLGLGMWWRRSVNAKS